MRTTRRHILLLEVLIAFMLVVMCIFPLLQPHLYMMQEEKGFIRQVELDRVVSSLYADLVVEGFHRGNIFWDRIAAKESTPVASDALKKLGFTVELYMESEFSKGKKALEEGEEEGEDAEKFFHLLKIDYICTPVRGGKALTYTYRLAVERPQQLAQEVSGA